jgi:hypothetical protein
VAAEAAVTVKRSSDASTVSALMQLEAAVGASRVIDRVVEDHRRLVASRAKARRDKG